MARRHQGPSRARRRLAFEPLEKRDLFSVTLPSPGVLPGEWTDLGTVDFGRYGLATQAGPVWYRLTAKNLGLLTIVREGNSPTAPSQPIGLYTQGTQGLIPLATGDKRLDVPVEAGQTVYVCIAEPEPGERLGVVNLLRFAGSAVIFQGSSGADTLVYDGQGGGSLVVNGIEYVLPVGWSSLTVVGGGGADTISVRTAGTDESVSLSATSTRIVTSGRTIAVADISQVVVETGSTAVAEILDGPGNDEVTLGPRFGSIRSQDFFASVSGPQVIHAYSRSGGGDKVTFFDSAGADQASFQGDQAVLRGTDYYNRAKFFADVTFAGSTGNDVAVLTGSNNADYVSGRLGDVTLATGGRTVRVVGFWTTNVRSGGGTDTAEIDDSSEDDFVFAYPADLNLFNLTRTLRIQGFAYSHVYARNGGFDTAYFYDSPGDDTFVGRPEFSLMTTGAYTARVKFFDAVYAYSRNGGFDVARLFDSPGDDLLRVRPYYTRLEGSGFANRVETFATVVATGGAGGNDRAEVFGGSGVDRVRLSDPASEVWFAETPTSVQLRRFSREEYSLGEEDEVIGQLVRAVTTRGRPSTTIYAADYYDPASPTLGFQNAVDALPVEGGVVVLPPGSYTLRQGLVLRSNVTLRGSDQGTTLVRKNQAYAFLTETARAGDRRLSVTSTTGFQIGDEVSLLSRGESVVGRYIITGIEPGTLILDRPIDQGVFRPEDQAEVTNIFSLIRAEGTPTDPVRNVLIENIVLNGNLDPAYKRWRAAAPATLYLLYAANSVVRKVTVLRSPTSGIVFDKGRDNLVEDSIVIEPRNVGIALGWESDGLVRGNLVRGAGYGMASTGWGEGIMLNGGRDIRVENNIAEYNVGHGLHPAGDLTVGGLWTRNVSRYNQGNGFHYCFNNYGVWAVGNELYGNDMGVGGLGLGGVYGDRFNLVANNTIYNNLRHGVYVNGGRDNWIIGNKLVNNSQKRPGRFAEIMLGEVWTTVVVGNSFTPSPGGVTVDTRYVQLLNVIVG